MPKYFYTSVNTDICTQIYIKEQIHVLHKYLLPFPSPLLSYLFPFFSILLTPSVFLSSLSIPLSPLLFSSLLSCPSPLSLSLNPSHILISPTCLPLPSSFSSILFSPYSHFLPFHSPQPHLPPSFPPTPISSLFSLPFFSPVLPYTVNKSTLFITRTLTFSLT